MLACRLQFSHVSVDERHASLAILPSLEKILVVIPSLLLSNCTTLKKDLAPMLECEESAHCRFS